jgi:hypothetical protein
MLSSDQIESLFAFCRQHFVYYYDVQVELVDHLANAIEAEMLNDPKISFEKALKKIHESFGLFGFAPLVAEKEKMALRQSRKIFWTIFKEQFTWPKILTFFLLMLGMFTIFSKEPFLIKWTAPALIIIGWPFYLSGIIRFQRLIKKTGKKFLMENISWVTSFILIPSYFANFPNSFKSEIIPDYSASVGLILFYSTLLSVYIILIVAISQTLSLVTNSLHKTYPEVFSVTD